jgi:hypothetical protein
MAWLRPSDECDVYVFENFGGWIECCRCHLTQPDPMLDTVEEMLAHLEEHRKAGHKVPSKACPYRPGDRHEVNNALAKERSKYAEVSK